jgi:hypothetical protein
MIDKPEFEDDDAEFDWFYAHDEGFRWCVDLLDRLKDQQGDMSREAAKKRLLWAARKRHREDAENN